MDLDVDRNHQKGDAAKGRHGSDTLLGVCNGPFAPPSSQLWLVAVGGLSPATILVMVVSQYRASILKVCPFPIIRVSVPGNLVTLSAGPATGQADRTFDRYGVSH